MSGYKYEMKVPIRPAPPPPVNSNISQKSKPSATWNSSSKVSQGKVSYAVQKKKPPPRPPPPKFSNLKQDKKNVSTRPSQLITSLFQKKSNSSKIGEPAAPKSNQELTDQRGNNILSLIDFNSPPGSPTFTTRSSSDALSVNSFGSDGVTPCSTSSGNTSNVESGFEDDFDFFLGSTKKLETQIKDPWSISCQDQRQKNPSPLLQSQKSGGKNSAWAGFSSLNAIANKKNLGDVSSMPTIIRVRPERPKPVVTEKVLNNVSVSNVDVLSEIFQNSNQTLFNAENCIFEREEDEDEDDGWSSESPPMPTCPPPAPPVELLHTLLETDPEILGLSKDKPHGIALYNFGGEHPNDLSFKENDVITLVRKIDDNWFVGEMNGREGTVPANFLSIRIPLENGRISSDPHVTALYSFRPETWEDLEFEEGTVIKILGRIDQDWLYGEANGRTGQFPANFVDRIPADLQLIKK